jgi:hypothetical protein
MRKFLVTVFILNLAIFFPFTSATAAPKKMTVKEGASCPIFGKTSKNLFCTIVDGKNIWQSITLSGKSKKYPSESSECFFFKNIIVLGVTQAGELGQLECVWDNGIIGSKAHWKSNQWTYKKALSDNTRGVIANGWKSIVSMPKSNNKFNITYHIENGVNEDVVQIYKENQNIFLQYFGDYFDPKLPFHTVISNSWEYLISENQKIDSQIPGYSKWFSETHNKKYWERAKSQKSVGYPYASKKDVCSYHIDSNFNSPCPKLDGYVTGILLYPGYKLFGDEVAMPAHEAFELVQESIANNHFAWPAWLRSGGPSFIGSVIATKTDILSVKGGVLNPIPNIPKGPLRYDLTKAEDLFNQEKYSHGRYANAMLIGNNGITSYLKFLKDASDGTNWEKAMKDNFGFDKLTFYKNFEEFLYQYSATN